MYRAQPVAVEPAQVAPWAGDGDRWDVDARVVADADKRVVAAVVVANGGVVVDGHGRVGVDNEQHFA